MNKLSPLGLLGSHTFDQFKISHGWKEKEDRWGIKKFITDEDETFDNFEDIGNEALNPKSEWMEDLIEVDGVRDAIYNLARKEENDLAIEVMEQYDSYFDDEDEEEVTVVAVKKRGKKKGEKTDDTESLEERVLSGDKKALEELKQRMREEGQAQAGEKSSAKTVKKKKSTAKKTTPKKSTKKKSGGTSSARSAAKPAASEKKNRPAFLMKDLYVAEIFDYAEKVNDNDYFTLRDLDVSGIAFEHIAAADSAEDE